MVLALGRLHYRCLVPCPYGAMARARQRLPAHRVDGGDAIAPAVKATVVGGRVRLHLASLAMMPRSARVCVALGALASCHRGQPQGRAESLPEEKHSVSTRVAPPR